jgi:phospholipid/cholesterol/gamma-HCH transport system substrate-binding protein
MKRFDIELTVGIFIIAGIICLGYLSIKLGRMEVLGNKGYDVIAIFTNSGGLKTGSSIKIAGVDVGRVKGVSLEDYRARITMNLSNDVKIQEDAIVSIKTKGLIGEKFIEITPGGSDTLVRSGERLRETQPAIDLEQLLSTYIFGTI